jgi:hypothetical protein
VQVSTRLVPGEYLRSSRHVSKACVLAIVTLRSVVALRCVVGKLFLFLFSVGPFLFSISISKVEMSLTYIDN